MKKIIIYAILLGVVTIGLTGCTIKLDDDECGKIQETIKSANIDTDEVKEDVVKEFEKIKLDENTNLNSSTNKNENENKINSTEDKEISFIDYAIVQEEFNGYMNVFGYNKAGEILWKYTTKKAPLTEWGCNSEYIGNEYGAVYIIDNGKLKVLGESDGKVLCESEITTSAGRSFVLAGDKDIFEAVFIYSSVENVLYEFNSEDGSLVKKLDLYEKTVVNPTYVMEMTYEKKDILDGNSCVDSKSYLTIIAYAGEDDVSYKVIVDIDDFSYQILGRD